MTYPPPGGENPQQYQLQPEPQQPSDPYMQGYNSTPPPAPNYYQPQPGYSQPPTQPPMMPQVGVQPGYLSAPGAPLPPPIPQPQQGGSLGLILGVVVGLVILLGVAAVLIIPGLIGDDEADRPGGETSASESPSEDEPEPTEDKPTPTEEATEDTGGDTSAEGFEDWSTPVSSEDYDANTPEGAAITYMVAADSGDDETLQSVVCANPTSDLQFDLEYELEGDGEQYGFLYWGLSRETSDGLQSWAGWTWDDTAPGSQEDLDTGGGYYFTVVEEEGQWKVCDVSY